MLDLVFLHLSHVVSNSSTCCFSLYTDGTVRGLVYIFISWQKFANYFLGKLFSLRRGCE